MASNGGQVSSLNEANEKRLLGHKGKGKNVLQSSKGTKRKRNDEFPFSVGSSEDSFTYTDTSNRSSGSSSGSKTYSDGSYQNCSRSIDSMSEYYYSDSASRQSEDTGTNSDSGASSKTSSRFTTRKEISLDAHRKLTRYEPQWLPGYRYVRTLGKGSFAVVYLSYSEATKTHVAVKFAKPFRRGSFKSLTREAEILKQLNSPYVIEYLGERRVPVVLKSTARSGRTLPKLVPMVTEIYIPYMKNGTLADEIRGCLKKKQRMAESVIQHYTHQILSGLCYLHSKNIVHCDVKGSNVLLGERNLKISDFGVSKRVGTTLGEHRGSISRAGTRAWMAPEVHMRVEQGFPADVWSLGCTVVQMITGKPPLSRELKDFLFSEMHAQRKHFHMIPKDLEHLSSECIDFLRKCFIEDTKARWTCQQLLDHPFLKLN